MANQASYPICNAYYLHTRIGDNPILRECRVVDFEEPVVWVIPSGHTNGEPREVGMNVIYSPDQLVIQDMKRRKVTDLKPNAQTMTGDALRALVASEAA